MTPRAALWNPSYSPTSMTTRQWSLGPHSAGVLSARTLTRSDRAVEAKTKSSCLVAVSGVCLEW